MKLAFDRLFCHFILILLLKKDSFRCMIFKKNKSPKYIFNVSKLTLNANY